MGARTGTATSKRGLGWRSFAILSALMAMTLQGFTAPAGAIIQGQPDGNRHPYVGMAFNDQFLCSGSMITSTVFLTAGHCTELFKDASLGQTWVTFQEDATSFPEDHLVESAHTYPGYCGIDGGSCWPGLPRFASPDVGVLILAEPVSLSRYGLLPEVNLVDSLSPRTPLIVVGYGIRDQERDLDPGEFAKRFFARTKLIENRSKTSDVVIKVADNPAKGGSCFGDSGGPHLLRDSDTILGVNSFGTNINCAGVGYSARIDTPAVLAWIQTFL